MSKTEKMRNSRFGDQIPLLAGAAVRPELKTGGTYNNVVLGQGDAYTACTSSVINKIRPRAT